MTRSIYLRHKEPYSKDAYGLGLSGKKPTRDSLGGQPRPLKGRMVHLSSVCSVSLYMYLFLSSSHPPTPPFCSFPSFLPFYCQRLCLLIVISLELLSPSWLIPPPCLLFCATRCLLVSAAAADCMSLCSHHISQRQRPIERALSYGYHKLSLNQVLILSSVQLGSKG